MRRRPIIAALLVLALLASVYFIRRAGRSQIPRDAINAPAGSATAPGPVLNHPNVLLVSIDTVRPDHLGCYAYDRKTSPNIDALASRGVRFAAARTQAPWTLPSHMSLFTSMLPSHNRVENINEILPDAFPTLAQVMQAHRYDTAAFVNNGQMRAHWGFDRGFAQWREFEADRPAGSCENISTQAVQWLQSSRARPGAAPFFLFLHYYDAHDPYDPPEQYRKQFGSNLTGMQARRIVWRGRSPGQEIPPAELEQLKGSYDGEIAWLDHELGRVLENVPPNTLVVLFSDHGEAFKEHGWTLHGATLFDEEIHTVLVMAHPALRAGAPPVIDTPVMLMDVAPTVLALCGFEPPPSYEGASLAPLLAGGKLPDRIIASETKSVLEGRALKMVALPPWKLVNDLFDGSRQLYKLPDEHNDLAAAEPTVAAKLGELAARWAGEDDYWMLYAHGSGEYEVSLSAKDGQCLVFIPINMDYERDSFEPAEDGKSIHWTAYPGGKTKGLYLQMSPASAPLTLDLKVSGESKPDRVFIGARRTHPARLPCELNLTGDAIQPPAIDKPFAADAEGLYVERRTNPSAPATPARGGRLDQDTIRQLRSLGYLQ